MNDQDKREAAEIGKGQIAKYLQKNWWSDIPPTNGQVPTWISANGKYVPTTPAGGGGTTNHSALSHEDFATSGHTGPLSAAQHGVVTTDLHTDVAFLAGRASGTSLGSGASNTGATTGPPGTLTDSGAAWTVNAFAGALVTCNGKTMVIASNTATVITGVTGWSGGTNPGTAHAYTITSAGQTLIGGVGAADLLALRGSAANLTQPILLLSPLQMARTPNNTILSTDGTALITFGIATPQLTLGVSGSNHGIRLNDRVGIGGTALSNAVLTISVPTGFTAASQLTFNGTKTMPGGALGLNLVSMITSMDAAGTITTGNVAAFNVAPRPFDSVGGGSFATAGAFALHTNPGAVNIGNWSWFRTDHPSGGPATITGNYTVFDIGDVDDASVTTINGILYGLRFGDSPPGGGVGTFFGQQAAGTAVIPISQEAATGTGSSGLTAIYNVLAANVCIGANQAPIATLDVQGALSVSFGALMGAVGAPAAGVTLDVRYSGSGGTLRIPQITTAQKAALPGPAVGDILYDTNLALYQKFLGGIWVAF